MQNMTENIPNIARNMQHNMQNMTNNSEQRVATFRDQGQRTTQIASSEQRVAMIRDQGKGPRKSRSVNKD